MLGYQFMTMRMEGNRDGTERVSSQDVLQQFMVAPTRMSMDMHLLNVMYAPSTDFTLMMMLGYLDKSMLHLTQAGGTFQMQSSGLGDLKVSVNQVISEAETTNAVHRFALTYGLSLPTGSIDEEDFLPAIATNARLPYPMQLGSGTVDPSIGALYLGYTSHYYWGTQIVATMRTGENDNGYRLGSRLELESWINRAWTDSVSTFARLSTNHSGNIHGADPTLNPMMVPTADPDRPKTITIGVLGEDPCNGALETINGKTVNGQSIRIKRLLSTDQSIDDLQVLIVGGFDGDAVAKILASAANQPILTIADMDVFKVEGAIISLFRKGTRQKFGVDRKAAMQAGLTLGSQLLQIAAVVN